MPENLPLSMSRGAQLLIAAAALHSGCIPTDTCRSVHATTPKPVEAAVVVPDALSHLEVPVAFDLAPALAEAQKAIPAVFRSNGWNGRSDTEQGYTYEKVNGDELRWRIEVVAISSSYALDGSAIDYQIDLAYRFHGQIKQFGFWVGGYCGANDRPTIALTLKGTTAVTLTDDWKLSPRSSISASSGACSINVAFWGTNVGPYVQAAVNAHLVPTLIASIDGAIAAVPSRDLVDAGWARLQQPVELPGAWLALRPQALLISPLVGSGSTVHATIGATARPSISTTRPEVASIALPDAKATTGGGFHLHVPVTVALPDADRLLASLRNTVTTVGDQPVTLTDLALSSAGSGLLRVDVAFNSDGEFCGTVTLTGKPELDVVRQTLSFSSLDFAASTDSLLLDAYAWLRHSQLRDQLRRALRFELSPTLEQARIDLVDTARSSGLAIDVRDLRLLGAEVGRDALVVHAQLIGGAQLIP